MQTNRLSILVVIIDKNALVQTIEFNFLVYKQHIGVNAFGVVNFGINTTLYGTDFSRRCIMGFYGASNYFSTTPIFYMNINTSGIFNTI
jgi:hypothetical protein